MNGDIRDPNWAKRELLAGNPLFFGLPQALFDELIAASRLVQLPARRALFAAGEPIREAHILVSGNIERSTTIAGERKKVIELVQSAQLLSPGEIFGAQRYASSCRSIGPSLLIALEVVRLRSAVQCDSGLAWRLIQMLAERQCAIDFDATVHHHGLTGTQRVLAYLLEQAGERSLAGETAVALKASKTMIAARVGMTPESFSRSLRQLRDSGIIVVEGRNVYIQNAALADSEMGDATQRLHFPRKARGDKANPGKLPPPGALVNLCGRLRMFSQRLAIAWGQASHNIMPAKAMVKLRQLDLEFARVEARLDRLSLPPAMREALLAVSELWPRYRQALFTDEPVPRNAAEVLRLSEEILLATDRLTGQAEKFARTPAAHYVNLAGRNRMLSQRIGKLFLFRNWPGGNALAEEIQASCAEFEDNLARLEPAGRELPEVAAQLEEVTVQWQRFRRALLPDLSHLSGIQQARVVMAEGDRLLRHVDTTVKLYERLSR